MSGLTRVEAIGSEGVGFLDKDGRIVFTISTAGTRSLWIGQPGMPQVRFTTADARLIAKNLKMVAKRLEGLS